MRFPHRRELFPSILLALGILASTAVAASVSADGWTVMAGPVVLVLSMIAAVLVDSRLPGTPPGSWRSATIMCSVILLAGLLVLLRDPSRMASLMPLVGASAAMPLILSAARRERDRRRRCLHRRAEESAQA